MCKNNKTIKKRLINKINQSYYKITNIATFGHMIIDS